MVNNGRRDARSAQGPGYVIVLYGACKGKSNDELLRSLGRPFFNQYNVVMTYTFFFFFF